MKSRSRTIKNQFLVSAILSLSLISFGVQAEAYMSPEANILYQQACTLEYQHNYNEAIKKIQEAIAIAGEDALLYTKLAGLYSETDQYDKALEAYNVVVRLRPDDAFVYISIGNIYELQSKHIQALEAYNQALKIFPQYKYNYLNIANVQYQMNDYTSAIENYEQFLGTYSNHREARESLANSYLSSNNPEKAIKEYETLYEADSVKFKDYTNYGLALFKTKNYSKAVEILEKALERDPDSLAAHMSLALSYQELGKNEASYNQYQIVFKQAPSLHSIRFDYANLLADMEKNVEAIAQYKIYVSHYGEDARAYKNMAIVYKRLNDYDNTIVNYEKSLALDPANLELKKELANCYHMKKDYVTALKFYDAVLEASPKDYDIKVNKAIALHAVERYEDAIDLYNEILSEKSNPIVESNLTDALVAQGRVELEAKNFTNSTKAFEKAISRGTKDSFAYFGLAKSYRACGVTDKVSELYEKAISMAPGVTSYSEDYAEFIAESNALKPARPSADVETVDGNLPSISVENPDVPAVVAEEVTQGKEVKEEVVAPVVEVDKNKELIKKGDELYKNDDYDESLKSYKAALKLNAEDEVTLLKIGNIYKIKNDNSKAMDFYKKAIIVNPDYTDGWFNLGLVYANESNIEKSKECFQKVVAIDPEYAYSYYALAIALEGDDNKEAAIENYKLFLKYNKDINMVKLVEDRINNLQK